MWNNFEQTQIEWSAVMRVSYNKLWRLMKANRMTKKELTAAADITSYAMSKMNNNQPVSLEVMMRVCKVFHCDIGDVMEMVEEEAGVLSNGTY